MSTTNLTPLRWSSQRRQIRVVEIVIDLDVRTYREAMELMALLACVDYDTWEQDVLAAETKSFYSESQSFSSRFVIRFEWIDAMNEEEEIRFVQQVTQYVFSPRPFDQYSSAYRETRGQLLSKTASQEMRRKCENPQIPVVLSGLLWSHKLLVCFQSELEAVYTSQHAPRGNTREDAPTCPFILTERDMCLEEWAPWQANTLAIDSLLAQCRVPLRKLSCAEWQDTVRAVRAALGNTVTYLDDVDGSEIDLSGGLAAEEARIAVYSPIAASRTLQTLRLHSVIDWDDSEVESIQTSTLKWWAFAAFSPCSRTLVDCFNLKVNTLTSQDAEAMVGVLNAKNPLQVLLNSSEHECKMSTLLCAVAVEATASQHLMTRRLMELELDASCLTQNGSGLESLTTILDRNHTLQVLLVRANSGQRDQANQVLGDYLSLPVYVRRSPMDLRAKLAFLSVLSKESSSLCAAMDHMGGSICSLIFGFAAPAIKRLVRVVDE